MNGFLCIDKPAGPSSFAAVQAVKRLLGVRKAGHSGTLDPAASGLLIVATGYATRLLPFLPSGPKTYDFTVQFGTETDTLDAEGAVVVAGKPFPRQERLSAALPAFTGEIQQEPPRYSSVKIKGKRAYELARKHVEFTTARRTVTIYSLTLLHCDEPAGRAGLRVSCSAGTYVRSLARDLARYLDTAGHVVSIRRLSIVHFTIDQAVPLDCTRQDAMNRAIGLETAFPGMPVIAVGDNDAARLAHGMDVRCGKPGLAGENAFFTDLTGTPLAFCERNPDGTFHPVRVFPVEAVTRTEAKSCAV